MSEGKLLRMSPVLRSRAPPALGSFMYIRAAVW